LSPWVLGGKSGPEPPGPKRGPLRRCLAGSPVSSRPIAARSERGELLADTDLELTVEAVTAAAVLRARGY
jgi:hypothetical protein